MNNISKEKLVIFAGAGISYDSPSCLPTGLPIMTNILSRVVPEQYRDWSLSYLEKPGIKEKRVLSPEKRYELQLLSADSKYEIEKRPGEFLRFEELIHAVSKYDKELKVFDVLRKCDRPNINHFILAKLLSEGVPVITTNFDTLIEQAFHQINGDHSDELDICLTDQHYQNTLNNKHLSKKLFKIHGSFSGAFTSHEAEIQATTSSVRSNRIKSPKTDLLSYILENHQVLFIGYSASDDLDLMPYISNVRSSEPIIWCWHSSGNDQAEPLKSDRVFNGDVTNDDLLGFDLLEFNCLKHKLRPLYTIEIDTSSFLKRMLSERDIDSLVSIISNSAYQNDLRKHFDTWFHDLRISEIDRLEFTQSINQNRNIEEVDINYHEQLTNDLNKQFEITGDPYSIINLTLNEYNYFARTVPRSAMGYRDREFLYSLIRKIDSAAIGANNKTLALGKKLKGVILYALDNYFDSKKEFREGIKCAEDEQDVDLVANNWHHYFYYFTEDEHLYQHYMDLAVKSGNLSWFYEDKISEIKKVLDYGFKESSLEFPYKVNWEGATDDLINYREIAKEVGDTNGEKYVNAMLEKVTDIDELNNTLHLRIANQNKRSQD